MSAQRVAYGTVAILAGGELASPCGCRGIEPPPREDRFCEHGLANALLKVPGSGPLPSAESLDPTTETRLCSEAWVGWAAPPVPLSTPEEEGDGAQRPLTPVRLVDTFHPAGTPGSLPAQAGAGVGDRLPQQRELRRSR